MRFVLMEFATPHHALLFHISVRIVNMSSWFCIITHTSFVLYMWSLYHFTFWRIVNVVRCQVQSFWAPLLIKFIIFEVVRLRYPYLSHLMVIMHNIIWEVLFQLFVVFYQFCSWRFPTTRCFNTYHFISRVHNWLASLLKTSISWVEHLGTSLW